MNILFNLFNYAFKSRTLLVGWLTFAAGLLSYMTGSEFITQFPELTSALVAVSGVVTMVLRAVTNIPLEMKD